MKMTADLVQPIVKTSHGTIGYTAYCPGCKFEHVIYTKRFNGNVKSPSFFPSLLIRFPANNKNNICHSFIKDGKWQFLNDCTHELAGQTVGMILVNE